MKMRINGRAEAACRQIQQRSIDARAIDFVTAIIVACRIPQHLVSEAAVLDIFEPLRLVTSTDPLGIGRAFHECIRLALKLQRKADAGVEAGKRAFEIQQQQIMMAAGIGGGHA